MNRPFFAFGQTLPDIAIPVLNERAVRAAAGLLFLGGIVAFMNAWLIGNFGPTRVFVLAFLMDFSIRLFVNPRYAPSLVLGQWMVRRQQPEWTGAPQKRFAWAIGFVLAGVMAFLVILKGLVGPLNLLVCALCLTLMFFETAFGICIGCWVYNRFNVEQAKLCPGGTCAYEPSEHERQGWGQLAAVVVAVAAVGGLAPLVAPDHMPAAPTVEAASPAIQSKPQDAAEAERCKVPEFAKAMGHEEKWKLHNHCE
ncbi:DUF4395 domain-containing protein [Ideonella paludis]|uniref:DUF4395 domain-containing protein n=1 Tax=Ideonella paludis TaxID=1233411 RepID=A0ABS5E3B6_9BURK|nr:DUF4395 domain-containing protein [Ideonella paludis]MBQ0937907.1 DUF4395 domain-containing protein [Ideonella paludis]